MRFAFLLTRATLEDVVCLQLKRHHHAVKTTQLCGRYQHSAKDRITLGHLIHLQYMYMYKGGLHSIIFTVFL